MPIRYERRALSSSPKEDVGPVTDLVLCLAECLSFVVLAGPRDAVLVDLSLLRLLPRRGFRLGRSLLDEGTAVGSGGGCLVVGEGGTRVVEGVAAAH